MGVHERYLAATPRAQSTNMTASGSLAGRCPLRSGAPGLPRCLTADAHPAPGSVTIREINPRTGVNRTRNGSTNLLGDCADGLCKTRPIIGGP